MPPARLERATYLFAKGSLYSTELRGHINQRESGNAPSRGGVDMYAAEMVGLEPTRAVRPSVFKTATLPITCLHLQKNDAVASREPATAAPPASLMWRKPGQDKLHCLCSNDANP